MKKRNIIIQKFISQALLITIITVILTSTAHAQTPSPTGFPPASAPLPEEKAVENRANWTIPKTATTKPTNNQLRGFQQIIAELFNKITRFFNLPKFFGESGSIHQATTPSELKPTGSIPNQLEDFLGGSTGAFGAELPKELQSDNPETSIQRIEQATFPEGIAPATGE